jgi:hypothetical protein
MLLTSSVIGKLGVGPGWRREQPPLCDQFRQLMAREMTRCCTTGTPACASAR